MKPTICACVTAVHHTHTCHKNHYMICKTIQHHAFGCKSQNYGCNTNLNAYTHKFVVIEGKPNKYTKTKSIAGFGIYQQGWDIWVEVRLLTERWEQVMTHESVPDPALPSFSVLWLFSECRHCRWRFLSLWDWTWWLSWAERGPEPYNKIPSLKLQTDPGWWG